MKAGLVYDYLKIDKPNLTELENTEYSTGLAAGVGLGIVYFVATKPTMMEFEYTIIDKDINLITIGMTFMF